jgi:NitT/TauT family transport system permease protein
MRSTTTLPTLPEPAPTLATDPDDLPSVPNQARRVSLKSIAPAGAALAVYLLHRALPNEQTALPTRLYPGLLIALLATSIVLAMVQLVWPRLRSRARQNGPLIAGAIFAIGLWDLVTLKLAWLPLPYFPGPDMVLQGMWDDRLLLMESTYDSLRLLLGGYAAGVVAGLVSGVLIGWFHNVRYWGMPLLKVVGPIPATAYVPLVMIMFSNAYLSGGMLIAMAVWFPMTMLTASGIANVPRSYLDVARTLGAGRGYLIFQVAIPAALPSIFLGLFMGLCASFLTLIVAETVGVKAGLGYYLKWQQGYVDYARVYAALIIMAAFFSGIMGLLFAIRDRMLGWQKGLIRW